MTFQDNSATVAAQRASGRWSHARATRRWWLLAGSRATGAYQQWGASQNWTADPYDQQQGYDQYAQPREAYDQQQGYDVPYDGQPQGYAQPQDLYGQRRGYDQYGQRRVAICDRHLRSAAGHYEQYGPSGQLSTIRSAPSPTVRMRVAPRQHHDPAVGAGSSAATSIETSSCACAEVS